MNNWTDKIKIRKWLVFLGILLCFLCFDYIAAIAYHYLGGDIKNLSANETICFLLIKYFVLIIVFLLIYRSYLKEKWQDFKKNIKNYFEISFKNWFIGFIIMIISNIIINIFVTGLGQNESSVQQLITKMPIVAFCITTLLAPFIEEMIFRKCLQDCFNNKTLYMITSGLLFGLIHVIGSSNAYEYLLIIPYGAVGLMFAKTINETDNIYSTILLHMLHNGALTILAMGVI